MRHQPPGRYDLVTTTSQPNCPTRYSTTWWGTHRDTLTSSLATRTLWDNADIPCSPLIHKSSHFIAESNKVGQAPTAAQTTLTVPITFFSLMCPKMFPKRIHFMIFSGIKVKLTGWLFPTPPFLFFFKMGVMFAFFKFLIICPDLHSHSNVFDSGFTRTPASSHRCSSPRSHRTVWTEFMYVISESTLS